MASLTDKSTVTLSMAIGGIFTLFSAFLWVDSKLGSLGESMADMKAAGAMAGADARLQFSQINSKVDLIAKNVEGLASDSLTREELAAWIAVLRASNPGMAIPEPPE